MKKTTFLMLMMIFFSLSTVYGFERSHEIRFLESLRGQEKSRTLVDPQLQSDAHELQLIREQRALLLKSGNIEHLSSSLPELLSRERSLLTKYGLKTQVPEQPTFKARGIHPEKKQQFASIKRAYQKSDMAKAPQEGVQKYRLDSIVNQIKSDTEWHPDEKQTFVYDYNGRVSGQQGYTVVEGSLNWVNEYRMTTEHNNQGMPLDMHYEAWDQELGVWYTEFRNQISYDDQGRPLSMKSFYSEYDEVSNSYILYGEEFMEVNYNAEGEMVNMTMHMWNVDSMAFIPHMKVEVVFENGRELMLASWIWSLDTNQWVGEWKFEYVPIADTPLMNYFQYEWDYNSNNWFIASKEEFEVSSNEFGLVISYTEYEWDYSTMSLLPDDKSVYSKPYAAGLIEEMNFGLVENYYWNAPESDEWKLDSRTINSFDSQGRVVISNTEAWAWSLPLEAYKWVDRYREESMYDSNGDLEEYLYFEWYYSWENDSNILNTKNKTTYSYNSNHEPTVITHYGWDMQLENWYHRNKTENSYNELGQLVQVIQYSQYNEASQLWLADRKDVYGYDATGETSLTGYYSWNQEINDWQLISLSEYLEDEEGRLLVDKYVFWSDNLNMEVVSYHEEYAYNEMGQMTLDMWISSNEYTDGQNYYLNSYGYKYEISYNSNGYMTGSLSFNYENGAFVQSEKMDIYYSSTHPGAIDYEIASEWDVESDSWIQTRKTVGAYNYDIKRNQMIVPFDEDVLDAYRYFEYMPVSSTDYMWVNEITDWMEYYRTLVYFTQAEFSSIDNPAATDLRLYPNPVRDQLQLQLPADVQQAELLLFDAQGRLISRAPVATTQTVDMTHLNAGLYFYRLNTDKGMFNGKIVKE